MVKEFYNARFADVEKGEWYPEGIRLRVRDGRIAGLVSPQDSGLAHPDPVERVDLKGCFVLPGLINSHCHLSLANPTSLPDMKALAAAKAWIQVQIRKNIHECLARGITTVRDAWSADLSAVRMLKKEIGSGTLPGPRILQSVVVSPPDSYLSSRPTLFGRMARSLAGLSDKHYDHPHSGTVIFPADAGEGEVRAAVDRALDDRGGDYIKIAEQDINIINFKPASFMTEAQLAALVNQAETRGKRTLMHQVSLASFRRGLRAGVRCLSHLPRDGVLDDQDIAACLASGVVVEPTLSVAFDACWPMEDDPFAAHPDMVRLSDYRKGRFEALVDEFYVPELKEAAMRTLEAFKSGNIRAMGLMNMKKLFAYYSPMIDYGIRNFRLLSEARVPMTCANDGGIPPCTPAMVGNELELAALFNGGSDAAERIRRATLYPARALGKEDQLGSLAPGRHADFAVYAQDPYKDPGQVGKKVASVYKDGSLLLILRS